MLLKYEEIAESIVNSIKSGEFIPGQKIPSENELAKTFSTSRITARKGINIAINRGYLYSIQGKGTFVVDESKKFEIDLNNLDGFTKRAIKLGQTPKNRILALESRQTDNYLRKVFSSDIEQVFYLERVRYIDDAPLALEYAHIHPTYIDDISLKDVANSFDNYIESKGIRIKHIKKEMKAVIPPSNVREILLLESNTPVIRINYYKYLENGEMLEYAKIFYNQKLFKFIQNIDL